MHNTLYEKVMKIITPCLEVNPDGRPELTAVADQLLALPVDKDSSHCQFIKLFEASQKTVKKKAKVSKKGRQTR